jgi:hypothetical protein
MGKEEEIKRGSAMARGRKGYEYEGSPSAFTSSPHIFANRPASVC